MENIAAIVVTYNREDQLMDCLDAIMRQTLAPSTLIIIDNHSTSATFENLLKFGFISASPQENPAENQILTSSISSIGDQGKLIEVKYVRKAENDGGAGGFYEGMKQAYECGADWLWMMDDDGVPADNQLEILLQQSLCNNLQFSNALVISIDDPDLLAFGLKGSNVTSEVTSSSILHGVAAAFNGTFLSRNIVKSIGFIKKEMFIWGDETEYTNRVRKNNFAIGTITSALHRHPVMKGKKDNVFAFTNKFQVVIKPKHFSHFYYRNLGYNTTNYSSKKAVLALRILYSAYFIRKGDFKEFFKFHRYFNYGINDNYIRK